MDDPLRVAIFAGAYDHIVDGVTLSTHRQVDYLRQCGIPVRVYAPSRGPVVLPSGPEFVRIPSVNLPKTDYCLARGLSGKALADLEAFAPTVVNLATPDWLGFTALRWARRHQLPTIATFHTHFTKYLQHYGCRWLQPLCRGWLRSFYNRVHEILVPCASIADDLKRDGIRAPITVNSYGVDPSRFHPRKRSLGWRRSLGFQDDDVVLLFAGRLVWEKGLRAFARTLPRLPTHRVLVVGDGPASPAFQKLIPQAVFTGRLVGEELATAFASSDLFFFPSASETFGCVTIEAMASGLPCVVADAQGSRDIVRPGIDGYLAPPENDAAFAEHLEPLIRGITLRITMAKQARERAKEYTWPRVLTVFRQRLEAYSVRRQLRAAA